MPTPLKPEPLMPGDRIGVVAPAGPVLSRVALRRGVARLQDLGFRVKVAPQTALRTGFMAGSDAARARAFMEMISDPGIKAVICARGGYGCLRLLPLLDFGLIRAARKLIVGSSDVTALLNAVWGQTGLVTFHGPMVCADFGVLRPSRFTLRHFLAVVSGRATPEEAPCTARITSSTVRTVRGGRARGLLVGGNLATLCAMFGTRWFPKLQGQILFIEDVNEPLYRIDRMLTQLLQAGVLNGVAGIAGGQFTRCHDTTPRTGRRSRLSLMDVFNDRLGGLGVPVVLGLPFGHVSRKATIPLGVMAELDATRGELLLLEPAVRA